MDTLKAIIATLTPTETKEFRAFIHRQKQKKERKDLELFELLLLPKKFKSKEIVDQLYNDQSYNSKNAYHTLRKRLIKHLADFIVLKGMDEDPSAASTVMGLVSLARYLFDKDLTQLGWNYLRKAEEMAILNEQYALLNTIYNLQIERIDDEESEDLKVVIKKHAENKKIVDEDERAMIANKIIMQQFEEIKMAGREFNIELIVAQVLRVYDLSHVVTQRPKLLYNTLNITRNATLITKNFSSFVPYATDKYKQAEKYNAFNKSNHWYKLSILYMICHALYRNKRFDECNKYLEEFHQNILQFNQAHYHKFYPKYILLKSAIQNYQGGVQLGIETLTGAIHKKGLRMSQEDLLDMKLNLSVYHFNSGEYKTANKAIMDINHSDSWCEKKMGIDWTLRKSLIETIIQFEMGNEEIALNRIRSINRAYSNSFNQEAYKKAKIFLDFIRYYIQDTRLVKEEKFLKKAEDALGKVPLHQFGIQTIAFYAWIKSKIDNRNYYDVMVEMVNQKVEVFA